MAKEGAVLQGVIGRLIGVGGCYGMEMCVEKNKVLGNSYLNTPTILSSVPETALLM